MAQVKTQPTSGYLLPATGAYATIKNGSVIERHTPRGPEARITFVVPSHARTELLAYIFGKWRIAAGCDQNFTSPNDGSGGEQDECMTKPTTYCCYSPQYAVQPYPMHDWSGLNFPYLYPDSYSMQPVDRSFTALADSAQGNPQNLPSAPTAIQSTILNYFCPQPHPDTNTGDSNSVEITVNYRWKLTGKSYTKDFRGHDTSPPGCAAPEDMVEIPPNTFISYRNRSDQEIQQIPGLGLRFKSAEARDNLMSFKGPDGQNLTDKDGNDLNNASFNVAKESKLKEIWAGVEVDTNSVEITWSNVPTVPIWYMEPLKGRVNSLPFLGYPAEGVLFEGYEYEPRGDFMGDTVYEIRLRLIAKTASQDGLKHWSNDENKRYVYKGRIGLWNRKWCPYAEKSNAACGTAPAFPGVNAAIRAKMDADWDNDHTTNFWQRITIEGVGDVGPYRPGLFSNLFKFNTPCCG